MQTAQPWKEGDVVCWTVADVPVGDRAWRVRWGPTHWTTEYCRESGSDEFPSTLRLTLSMAEQMASLTFAVVWNSPLKHASLCHCNIHLHYCIVISQDQRQPVPRWNTDIDMRPIVLDALHVPILCVTISKRKALRLKMEPAIIAADRFRTEIVSSEGGRAVAQVSLSATKRLRRYFHQNLNFSRPNYYPTPVTQVLERWIRMEAILTRFEEESTYVDFRDLKGGISGQRAPFRIYQYHRSLIR